MSRLARMSFETTLDSILQDIRYSIRSMVRKPVGTVAAIFTIVLAVSTNATVFNVLYGVLLRPLPYPSSESLVAIAVSDGRGGSLSLPAPDVLTLRNLSQSLDTVAFQRTHSLSTVLNDRSIVLNAAMVSRDFFRVFRVAPEFGRSFMAADEISGAAPVAIVSHAFFNDFLHGDAESIGKVLPFDNHTSIIVIGVLPTTFRAPDTLGDAKDVYILAQPSAMTPRSVPLRTYGRIAAGKTVNDVRNELAELSDRVLTSDLMLSHRRLEAKSLIDYFVADSRTALLIIAGMVACLLGVCIVNLVGLETVRLAENAREYTIRTAIGAPRTRLIRLAIFRAVLVGFIGCALAVLAVDLVHPSLLNVMTGVPRKNDIRLDVPIFVFSVAVALLTAVLSAVVPAMVSTRTNIQATLSASSATTTFSSRWRHLQNVAVSIQTALAVVLVIAAALLLRNLWALVSMDFGFNTNNVTTYRISMPGGDVKANMIGFNSILDGMRGNTGGPPTALALFRPLDGGVFTFIDGAGQMPDVPVQENGITEDYFSSIGVPVVQGRTFSSTEARGGAPVAIVSTGLAKRMWPDGSAIGSAFSTRVDSRLVFTVVGVVPDLRGGVFDQVRFQSAGRSARDEGIFSVVAESNVIYVPFNTLVTEAVLQPLSQRAYVITKGNPTTDIPTAIKRSVPNAVVSIERMDSVVQRGFAQQRFQTLVLGVFAVVALFLCLSGICSTITQFVAQGRRELGIRASLGATPSQLVSHVVLASAISPVIGTCAGIAASLAASRLFASFLFTIPPTDILTYVTVFIVFGATTMVAVVVPARRAASVNPITVLKAD